MLVGIDYFIKWIEVEPLAAIIARNVHFLVWKNIVCRFAIPHVIIIDNGQQFTDRGLAEFYEKLDIKHITRSANTHKPTTKSRPQIKSFLINLKKDSAQLKGSGPKSFSKSYGPTSVRHSLPQRKPHTV